VLLNEGSCGGKVDVVTQGQGRKKRGVVLQREVNKTIGQTSGKKKPGEGLIAEGREVQGTRVLVT